MKVDFYLPVGEKHLPTMARQAVAAEALGFAGLWTSETKHKDKTSMQKHGGQFARRREFRSKKLWQVGWRGKRRPTEPAVATAAFAVGFAVGRAAAPHLKVIGRAGSGIDNIDLEAAFRHRVLVVHAPRGNVVAVAEHTMALVLALARQLPAASASLKAGRWEKRQLVGVELAHKTLGILGLGRIGREVARLAQAFSMLVLASDPLVSAEQARSLGVTLPGKEEVLRQADVVTLHAAPAGNAGAVRPLIGARELALLKPGAFLVNCARGGLIDEAALLDALERGRLAGVALDVFSQEPIGDDALLRRLLAHERVLPTPHLGASTSEAQARVAVEVARQVIAALLSDN